MPVTREKKSKENKGMINLICYHGLFNAFPLSRAFSKEMMNFHGIFIYSLAIN